MEFARSNPSDTVAAGRESDNAAAVLDALLASLDRRGRDFERLCKWLLQNEAQYRSRLERVWLWDEWPGRPGRDLGIDLVAVDREGGLWAVQAKHYDPAYSIKKADLDSFLSASSKAEFTYRLLIATTDHLGPNARNTIAIQEKPVGVLLRSQLEALEVVWPNSLANLRPASPVRKRSRPHQRRAVKDCAENLMAADRGQLVMPCGTGKTLVGAFLAERLAAKRVLVLVPSLSLLGQTLREWATAVEFDYLAVCSDDTVTKGEHDAVVASTSELGVPVTTDPARIVGFLRRRGNEMKVVFSTYQSSPRLAAAQADRVPTFDLVIADEAHRCVGPEAGVFATVLDSAKIKGKKRLFMTATPRYFTGRVKRVAAEEDLVVASMDEEAKFGRVLHRLTFARAIDQDLLSDYRVVVFGVSDHEARDLAQRGAFVTRDGTSITDARTLARQIGLLRSMAKYDLHRVVTFHSRIDHASRFASSLSETKEWLPVRRRPTGTLWTEHVSGRMSAGERDARLRRLKSIERDERGVLTNARCLTEGVDVPTLDGIAFIDPRGSQVDVVQAVGRAIRKSENKALGTIIVPVLVEEGLDPAAALESSEFDRVVEIVRALRDHDDDLAEELDELRRGQGRLGSLGRRPGKIVLDVPIAVGLDFARAFDARVVTETTTTWEFWFGLLQRFVARVGHAHVHQNHVEDGHLLGQWCKVQRTWFNAGRLSDQRAARLAAVPGWAWGLKDARWEDGFARLQSYVAREGHARVPKSHVEDGLRLGQWTRTQRRSHAAGRLSDEQVARLAALPEWAWDSVDTRWEDSFTLLERFVARYGHADVLQDHVEDGYSLGRWVSVQRIEYRAGRLSDERAARLAAVPGWSWDAITSAWEQGYSTLERFVTREGHALVPARHREGDFRLGQWVVVQRSFRVQRRLSAERTARLEAVPGWAWSANDAAWERGYAALTRYAARERDARVPRSHREDGYPLGQWVSAQRGFYAQGRLSGGRAERLEALPHWTWNTRKT
jgi:superfamily II DNA or RNA helicase